MSFRHVFVPALCLLVTSCESAAGPDVPDDRPQSPRVASVSITSTPDTLRFLGATATLTAEALDSSGARVQGATIAWTSLASGVATVGSDGVAKAVSSGEAPVVAAVSGLADTVTLVVRQTPTAVDVVPSNDTLAFRGDTVTLRATARDFGGSVVPDAIVTWTSADASVVEVSPSGLAVARGFGQAQVVGSVGSGQGAATLVVTQRPVDIRVTEGPLTLPVGVEADLWATVLDGAGEEVAGAAVAWSSRDIAVATVTSNGRARGISPGATWAIATSGAMRDSVALVVQQSLAGIRVTPSAIELDALDAVAEFTAVGVDGAGNTLSGALAATWRISDASVAASLGDGRFRASKNGSATVVAAVGAMEAQAAITVRQRATRLTLAVDDDTLYAVTATTSVRGVAEDRRGHPILSRPIVFASSDPGVASVNPSTGVVIAQGPGDTWISGAIDAARDSVKVVVRQDPVRVRVLGGNRILNVGETVTLTAEVLDAKDKVVSGATVAWSSSDGATVSVDAAGSVTALAIGSAWIIASRETLRDSVSVSVAAVFQGDLVISSAEDLAAAAAAGYVGVAGRLTIQGTNLATLDGLETIQSVSGEVTVSDNGQLRSLSGLSGLRTAAAVTVERNAALESMALPALESVAFWVVLATPGGAQIPVSLPALRQAWSVTLLGSTEADVSLPSLEVASGRLNFQLSDARSLSLPSLTCVHGGFTVRGASLQSLSAPSLERVGYCPSVPGTTSAPLDLDLRDNPSLTGVSLGSLNVVVNTLYVERTGLTSLDLPSLQTAARISIRHSPITALTLPALQTVPSLVIQDVAAQELDLPSVSTQAFVIENASLRRLGGQMTGGELNVTDNPALEALELGAWTSGTLWIENNVSLPALSFPGFTAGGLLIVRGNTVLRSLSAPSLQSASGIGVNGNPLLDAVAFPSLTALEGGLTLSETALVDLSGFSALRSGLGDGYGPGLTLSGNTALQDLSGLTGLGDALGADPIITGAVVITDNPVLGAAAIQAFIDALEAKYGGTAMPDGVTVSGNG